MKLKWGGHPFYDDMESATIGAFRLSRYTTGNVLAGARRQIKIDVGRGEAQQVTADTPSKAEAAALAWIRQTCSDTLTALGDAT